MKEKYQSVTIGYPPPLILHEGEMALGLAVYDYCTGHSYSGSVAARDTSPLHATRVNGRQPRHGMGQEAIYMMTFIPLPNLEDLKVHINEAIHVVTPSEEAASEYVVIRFCMAPKELGSHSSNLLLGLSPGSEYRMCLRDIMLTQLEPSQDSSSSP